MRKVILYISMSVDGFIADKTGGVSWINGQNEDHQSDYGYQAFTKQIDTVIMGYRTYRQIVDELSPDEWVYQGLQSYVFTHRAMNDCDDIKFINEDISSFLSTLKKQDGKNIWICGGADLLNKLVKTNEIDEYHITTIPLILGNGIRLFQDNNSLIKLRLQETKAENGIITNIYTKR